MHHRVGPLSESVSVIVSATLAGVACCGPILIQWLGLLLFAVGGQMLLKWLVHFEIPILAIIAATAFLGSRLAPDRLTRWANTLLAGVALLLAMLRALWEVRRGAVMAVAPVYQLFIDRQTVLLTAAGLVLVVRLALLIVAFRRRGRSFDACPANIQRLKSFKNSNIMI
jgi:hypothetical protein